MHRVKVSELKIAPDRQRKEFEPNSIIELAESIEKLGLMHPVVVRQVDGQYTLVAGERRIRALQHMWLMGASVHVGGEYFEDGIIPCTDLAEMDAIDAFEAELDENIKRTTLTWQEKATATSQLYELRKLQAEKNQTPLPTVADIARELSPDPEHPRGYLEEGHRAAREEIIVAKHLDDPDVAKAPTRKEAMKVLKRKEASNRMTTLGELVGRTFNSSMHTCFNANCLDWMTDAKDDQFDIILTDPPYGMDAQDFGDSNGKTPGGHKYDDSLETWHPLMEAFAGLSYRISKPEAHCYIFCDIDNFHMLRSLMRDAGWETFRTPFIWVNPTGMRAPWPEHGPQRKWQAILYAMKGKRKVLSLKSDVLTYPSDTNEGHHAQKPVALFEDLLKRSARPGDNVLDPFCGSGTIFPACHNLRVKATGIELDKGFYGLAVKRLGALK
jgi:DNA modification methylase/ParB-like chromosome segregation protein Spo0J